MKRHKALIKLSHDHHQGLMLAQLIKLGAPEYKGLPKDSMGKMNYTIKSFNVELKIHFENEENILFPLLKGKSSQTDSLILKLLEDHVYIVRKIVSLKADEQLEDELDLIGKRLERHIRIEERELFQLAQSILNDDELNEIEEKINQSRSGIENKCSTN